MHILVIEDEQKMANALGQGLETDGHSVRLAHTGEDGFFLINSQAFDLVILDVMLPGRDGLEILTTVRRCGIRTPVLVLTSKDTVDDRVRGLDAGADDYLIKPFAFSELLARIRAVSRRGVADAVQNFKLGDLEMESAQRVATRAGQRLDLTAREFDLLGYLFANQGRVVSREMLARDIWKETVRHTPLDNVIDAQMARLRRKVDGPFERKLLHTVRGVGFILKEEAEP